jgi:hypothetical protein
LLEVVIVQSAEDGEAFATRSIAIFHLLEPTSSTDVLDQLVEKLLLHFTAGKFYVKSIYTRLS